MHFLCQTRRTKVDTTMEPQRTQTAMNDLRKQIERAKTEQRKKSKIPRKHSHQPHERIALADITLGTSCANNQAIHSAPQRTSGITKLHASPALFEVHHLPPKHERWRASGDTAKHNIGSASSQVGFSRLPRSTTLSNSASTLSQPLPLNTTQKTASPTLVPQTSKPQSAFPGEKLRLAYVNQQLARNSSTCPGPSGVRNSHAPTPGKEISLNHTGCESIPLSPSVICDLPFESPQQDSNQTFDYSELSSGSDIAELWDAVRVKVAQRHCSPSATYGTMSAITGMLPRNNRIIKLGLTLLERVWTFEQVVHELQGVDLSLDSMVASASQKITTEGIDLACFEGNLLCEYSISISSPPPADCKNPLNVPEKNSPTAEQQPEPVSKPLFPPPSIKELCFKYPKATQNTWLFGLCLYGSFNGWPKALLKNIPSSIASPPEPYAPFLYVSCTLGDSRKTEASINKWKEHARKELTAQIRIKRIKALVNTQGELFEGTGGKRELASSLYQFGYIFTQCKVQIWWGRVKIQEEPETGKEAPSGNPQRASNTQRLAPTNRSIKSGLGASKSQLNVSTRRLDSSSSVASESQFNASTYRLGSSSFAGSRALSDTGSFKSQQPTVKATANRRTPQKLVKAFALIGKMASPRPKDARGKQRFEMLLELVGTKLLRQTVKHL